MHKTMSALCQKRTFLAKGVMSCSRSLVPFNVGPSDARFFLWPSTEDCQPTWATRFWASASAAVVGCAGN